MFKEREQKREREKERKIIEKSCWHGKRTNRLWYGMHSKRWTFSMPLFMYCSNYVIKRSCETSEFRVPTEAYIFLRPIHVEFHCVYIWKSFISGLAIQPQQVTKRTSHSMHSTTIITNKTLIKLVFSLSQFNLSSTLNSLHFVTTSYKFQLCRYHSLLWKFTAISFSFDFLHRNIINNIELVQCK